jgi:hypothetical protein
MEQHRIKLSLIALLVGAGTIISPLAVAQSSNGSSGNSSSMQMGDMMKQCRSHCRQTTASIDKTMKQMNEAKQSNDPAKMRAVIDDAEKNLSEMKNHMSMCMDMMQKMHGGNMMSGHEKMQPSDKQK